MPPLRIITDESCLGYSSPGHPERPERISRALKKLRSQTDLPLIWDEPSSIDDDTLLRAHSKAHLARLAKPLDFDGDTPFHPGIQQHARKSVGGALAAMRAARKNETAFSLLRPPGHHATRDRAMGFCYLNSIAISVLEALATGVKRVAVYDFDVHHGNGTEAIFLNQAGVVFFSIHQHPAYPGTGTRSLQNCSNYPLPPHTPREVYRNTLEQALKELQKFEPELVAVSAGFDAYRGDPLAHETLEAEDFHWVGQAIHRLGIPSFSVLEGGYSNDLPELILAYLNGLSGNAWPHQVAR